jgi:hypothetical protein
MANKNSETETIVSHWCEVPEREDLDPNDRTETRIIHMGNLTIEIIHDGNINIAEETFLVFRVSVSRKKNQELTQKEKEVWERIENLNKENEVGS